MKLDPEKTAELAYSEWYRVFCGGAVISSVFTQLREKVGGPYASFPVDAFVFLEGGMAGWWMKESGYALAGPERKDRCARVTASVAYKLVQDLNAWKDGKFEARSAWAPGRTMGITGQQNCTGCHGDKVPAPPMAKK